MFYLAWYSVVCAVAIVCYSLEVPPQIVGVMMLLGASWSGIALYLKEKRKHKKPQPKYEISEPNNYVCTPHQDNWTTHVFNPTTPDGFDELECYLCAHRPNPEIDIKIALHLCGIGTTRKNVLETSTATGYSPGRVLEVLHVIKSRQIV